MDTNRPKPDKTQPPTKETRKQKRKPVSKRKITPNQKIQAKRARIQQEQEKQTKTTQREGTTGVTMKSPQTAR